MGEDEGATRREPWRVKVVTRSPRARALLAAWSARAADQREVTPGQAGSWTHE